MGEYKTKQNKLVILPKAGATKVDHRGEQLEGGKQPRGVQRRETFRTRPGKTWVL